MSIQSQSVNEEEEEIGIQQPAYHPPAPADELFDISTTVDPSYVISLIRKLLPPTMNAASTSDRVSGCDFASQGTNDVRTNGSLVSQAEDQISENKHDTMDFIDQIDRSNEQEGTDDNSNDREKQVGPAVGDDSWEEHGCILWDLATSRTHAELMVQNLVLEVILATLMISQSPRVTEISLGLIGNLACFEVSRKEIASVNGLVEVIVDQLFVDDTPCLCEEFRLLTLCLQGSEGITWAHVLQPENVLSRILWVVENTLNPQLIEKVASLVIYLFWYFRYDEFPRYPTDIFLKSVGFLLTISESQDEVRTILLPHLVKLGLPIILINLLAFEISKLVGDERLPERYPVLDIILRAIESLTIMDNCSQELCSSKKLLHLLGTLIKLADKIEVATSCVTAAVLIANLLSDTDDLILEINKGKGLLDIFPFASDDIEARNALWDIISRSLSHVQGEISPSNLHQYISILASKSDLIEEELLDHQLAASNKDQENATASGRTLLIRTAALKRINCMVSQWLGLKDRVSPSNLMLEYPVNERDLDRLKDCCKKYSNDFGSSLTIEGVKGSSQNMV
ncbi:Armadillo-like helical [Cynara cardunculus var. scolymus]|uniref:Armadillo-like helical n=1 Tax=Cynara cardunculus var. scolymus TaxID=59895 RepID=A0A124SHE4_CYNCS|nr:Armadillo-like helical [Cynara cardunculus var. scolymus]